MEVIAIWSEVINVNYYYVALVAELTVARDGDGEVMDDSILLETRFKISEVNCPVPHSLDPRLQSIFRKQASHCQAWATALNTGLYIAKHHRTLGNRESRGYLLAALVLISLPCILQGKYATSRHFSTSTTPYQTSRYVQQRQLGMTLSWAISLSWNSIKVYGSVRSFRTHS